MPKPPSQALNTQVTPAPALEKRMRPTYKTEYKMKIIAQADACKHGELGALLRREKSYSNQLSAWQSELKKRRHSQIIKDCAWPKGL
jgi:hypothetical protein|tara:strand:- start:1179 stop:1439 length:261 start_codon:yes stop_codon:yes gene_type:complete